MKGAGVQITQTGEAGDLSRHAGIVAGRLTQFADVLDTEPTGVVDAIEAAGVDLMMDTATDSGSTRGDHEQPTDPELRCLAMTRDDFARVLAAVQRSHSFASQTL